MNACVFLGPTLPADEALRRLDATILPPVRLGDVHRAVSRLRPRAIGIVDGYFQWTPAVWHKEILWAMGQGVHVFGAASMGALRAAELAPFGMRAVGRIAEAYIAGELDGIPFEDDDEVAVSHGPPESGYLGASEPMVDIRLTLARAVAEGVVRVSTAQAMVDAAKDTFFPDRAWTSLLDPAVAEHAALARWLPAGRVRQKRDDAFALLDAMQVFLAGDPAPASPGFAFERTTYWDRAERAFAAKTPDGLLAGLGLDPVQCQRLGEDELRAWYFARIAAGPAPTDLSAWLREAGFADAGTFHRVAFAAYLAAEAS